MSDNIYTPTTDEIANAYCDWNRTAFDRWLAERDRATAERAWDELFVTQFDGAPFEMGDTTGIRDPNNPYREGAERD